MLALIALLVVTASPTFVKLLRDRRVNRAASQVVDYMRTARTMAIGRGQPILLSWDAKGKIPQTLPGGTGHMTITEPIISTFQVSTTCSTTKWGTATTQAIAEFDLQSGLYEYTSMVFYDEAGKNPSAFDICFSPTGRMYIRSGTASPLAGAFSQVTGVPNFAVFNLDSNPTQALGAARWVYLMPNGTARLQL